MIGASVILGLLYLYLKRKELVLRSGDAWSSIWASLVKTGLKRLNKETIETRNWRPNVLMFSGEQENRPYLVELGKDITNRLGILTGFELKVSNEDLLPRKKHHKTENFFMNVLSCRNIYDGMDEVVRVYGFSGVEPNTVLMGWNHNPAHRQRFVEFVLQLAKNNLNSLFVNHKGEKGFGNHKNIDIWWSGWGNNLSFAITLLRHLTSSSNWKDAKLRIFAITDEGSMQEKLHNSISKIIEEYRLAMEVKVINNSVDKLPVNELIWRESENSCLTILGISADKKEQVEKTLEFSNKLIDKLGTTLLINASSDFEVHNLVEEIQPGKKMPSIQEKLDLPVLVLSEYEVINNEIRKVDTEGLNRFEQFFDKTFSSYYSANQIIIDDLKSLVNTVLSNIEKLKDQPVKYKKNKIWIKSKTDFYFQANDIINKYSNNKLKDVVEDFKDGILWYDKELQKKIEHLDKKLDIPFKKIEFRVKKSDSAGLRFLKFRKRFTSMFSKNTVSLRHNYRKILNFYLKENGYRQLNDFLVQFNQFSSSFIASIRDAILLFENELEVFQKNVFDEDFQKEKFEAMSYGVLLRFDEIQKSNFENQSISRNNLLLEFRKNLQLLGNDLAKINANKIVAKKRRKNSYYQLLKDVNLSFSENWRKDKALYSSLLGLDLQMFSLQFRLKEELKDFRQKFCQQIDTGLLLKIKTFAENIKGITDPREIPEFDFDVSFLQQNDFSELLHKGIDGIIESVPEKVRVVDLRDTEISGDLDKETSSVEIPLKRVAKHYINFFLGGLIEVDLKTTSEEIKKITYLLKDHLSYMHFEMENIDDISMGETKEVQVIIQETIKEIYNEEQKIKKLREDFESNIEKNTKRAFDALSPHKIAKSSKEIIQTLRELTPKKGTGYIDKTIDDLRESFKSFISRVLYSRSEGVLLARELSERSNQRSLSEQMLDLLDGISPAKEVHDSIPTYYKNLFSGRSSISEDFWIERPIEQGMFEKAWRHYQSGYYGAVMVLGERNSGKTAFCRYATKKYCSDKQVYHVFPPANGSISIKDFSVAISHVTNLGGSVYQIFDKLPYHSVVVLNDLELWWESSENGLGVVKELFNLIKKYSSKCFFIINMNRNTYQKMRELMGVDDYFISILASQPFDSEELKDLILIRHRSGGLKMSFGKVSEDKISEIRLAGIFNKYFNYSEGNPGLALYAWLTSVNKLSGDRLIMSVLQKPNLSLFDAINDTWKVILAQLILHKRMDMAKLKRVLQIDSREIEQNINAMQMAGVITEKNVGLYIVNPILDKFLSNYLHGNGYL